jgi:hypothetical protein
MDLLKQEVKGLKWQLDESRAECKELSAEVDSRHYCRPGYCSSGSKYICKT